MSAAHRTGEAAKALEKIVRDSIEL